MRRGALLSLTLLAFVAGAGGWSALRARPASARPAEEAASPRAPSAGRKAPPREPAQTRDEPPAAQPVAAASPDVTAPGPGDGRVRVPVTVLRTYRAAQRVAEPGERAGPPNGTGFGLLPGRTWHPVPACGAATLRGRVLDADGAPLPRATVYRVDAEKAGADATVVSGRWLTEVATSDEDGAFTAPGQPAGGWLVAANWAGWGTRPQGLAIDGAARASLGAGADVVHVTLRLPVRRRDLAALDVAVTGEPNDPLFGVEARCAQNGTSLRDGLGRLDGLPAGRRRLTVTAAGYRPVTRDVVLDAGATVRVEIALGREDAGPHALRGRVVDEAGEGVAAADVYAAADHGGRWTRTRADGRFAFAGLGDRWTTSSFGLSVSRIDARDIEPLWRDGLRLGADEVVVSVRRAHAVHLRVADAATGAPCPLFDVLAESAAEDAGVARRVQVFATSFHEEDGEAEVRLAAGRYVLTIEAKDHLAAEVAVEVPAGAGEREIVVALPAE